MVRYAGCSHGSANNTGELKVNHTERKPVAGNSFNVLSSSKQLLSDHHAGEV